MGMEYGIYDDTLDRELFNCPARIAHDFEDLVTGLVPDSALSVLKPDHSVLMDEANHRHGDPSNPPPVPGPAPSAASLLLRFEVLRKAALRLERSTGELNDRQRAALQRFSSTSLGNLHHYLVRHPDSKILITEV